MPFSSSPAQGFLLLETSLGKKQCVILVMALVLTIPTPLSCTLCSDLVVAELIANSS